MIIQGQRPRQTASERPLLELIGNASFVEAQENKVKTPGSSEKWALGRTASQTWPDRVRYQGPGRKFSRSTQIKIRAKGDVLLRPSSVQPKLLKSSRQAQCWGGLGPLIAVSRERGGWPGIRQGQAVIPPIKFSV